MKIILSIVMAMLCLLLGTSEALAARSSPLVEKSYTFDQSSPRTAEQIREYILAGAGRFKELEYKIETDNPGSLQLEFNKSNRHYVSVLFTYDNVGFKTTYVTSKNLNYSDADGVRLIHPNYMVWMDEMFKQMKFAHSMRLNAKGDPSDMKALAELNFVTVNSDATVYFKMWDVNNQCGDFEEIGSVSHSSPAIEAERRKYVEEWNEKYKNSIFGKRVLQTYTPLNTTLKRHVPGLSPIQIQSRAHVAGAHCSPNDYRFTPESGKQYTVELSVTYTGGKIIGYCNLAIYDDTDTELRVLVPRENIPEAVPKENIPECKKKTWSLFGQTSN